MTQLVPVNTAGQVGPRVIHVVVDGFEEVHPGGMIGILHGKLLEGGLDLPPLPPHYLPDRYRKLVFGKMLRAAGVVRMVYEEDNASLAIRWRFYLGGDR